jgi:hypothetical protein
VQSVCDQSTVTREDLGLSRTLNPGWRVEVDCPTPAEWYGMLDSFEDSNFYQTWSYGSIRWGRRNLSHLVLKRNDLVVGMAQLRVVRPARLNFGMAHLRWGPVCHRRGMALDADTAAHMARALYDEYVCKRRLLLQILPNTFVGTRRAEVFQSAFSGFIQESRAYGDSYRTLLLDLTPPLEELRRDLDKKWRNQLTRSEKNGLEIVAGTGIAEFRTFHKMYQEMRKRKGFETTVDIEEFKRIQEDLPESNRMRILICQQSGIPVAGIVISALGNSAIYLLGATSDDGLNSKGAYLLQWTAIKWLKEHGFKRYDLGGIDPDANPGVYSFKKGLSGTDVLHSAPITICNSIVSSAVVRASLVANRFVRIIRSRSARRGRS